MADAATAGDAVDAVASVFNTDVVATHEDDPAVADEQDATVDDDHDAPVADELDAAVSGEHDAVEDRTPAHTPNACLKRSHPDPGDDEELIDTVQPGTESERKKPRVADAAEHGGQESIAAAAGEDDEASVHATDGAVASTPRPNKHGGASLNGTPLTGTPVGVLLVQGEAITRDAEVSKLLRMPRYFDDAMEHPNELAMRCFNCGMVGHAIRECTNAARQRPCHLCSRLGHEGRDCPNRLCFKCGQSGHQSRDCRNPGRGETRCLRCGQLGCSASGKGDYSRYEGACNTPYTKQDLSRCKCYVCGGYGHLCCKITPEEVSSMSCYVCASDEHEGEACPHETRPHLKAERSDDLRKAHFEREEAEFERMMIMVQGAGSDRGGGGGGRGGGGGDRGGRPGPEMGAGGGQWQDRRFSQPQAPMQQGGGGQTPPMWGTHNPMGMGVMSADRGTQMMGQLHRHHSAPNLSGHHPGFATPAATASAGGHRYPQTRLGDSEAMAGQHAYSPSPMGNGAGFHSPALGGSGAHGSGGQLRSYSVGGGHSAANHYGTPGSAARAPAYAAAPAYMAAPAYAHPAGGLSSTLSAGAKPYVPAVVGSQQHQQHQHHSYPAQQSMQPPPYQDYHRGQAQVYQQPHQSQEQHAHRQEDRRQHPSQEQRHQEDHHQRHEREERHQHRSHEQQHQSYQDPRIHHQQQQQHSHNAAGGRQYLASAGSTPLPAAQYAAAQYSSKDRYPPSDPGRYYSQRDAQLRYHQR